MNPKEASDHPKPAVYTDVEPPTIDPSHETPELIVLPAKKRYFHKWLIASIAVIITGVLIGFVSWLFIRQPITLSPSMHTKSDMQPQETVKTAASLAAATDVEPALNFVRSLATITDVESSIDETYSTSAKNFDVYDFQVPVNEGQSSRITFFATTDEELAQVDKTMKTYFEKNGFTERKEDDLFPANHYFFNEEYACDYLALKATPAKQRTPRDKTPYLSLVCTKTADYKESGDKLVPFYRQMMENKKYQLSLVIMQAPNFTDSVTSGYRTFEAAMVTTQPELTNFSVDNGRIVRFYQTPDKQWHMIENFDAKLSCADVDADADIKKAYTGSTCKTNDRRERLIEG